MDSIGGKVVCSFNLALKGVVLGLALCASTRAWANFTMTNPVTGESENYTWKFTGTDSWNGINYWRNSNGDKPSNVPGKNSSGCWDPILVDGSVEGVANISASASDCQIEGWNLRLGLYNGANVTFGQLNKYQNGGAKMWITVDETSRLTIAFPNKGNMSGNAKIQLSVAGANGITWSTNLEAAGGANNTFEYYLKGAGSVSYKEVKSPNHTIKRADVTLSHAGSKERKSKTLVSFTRSTQRFQTSDTMIYVIDGSVTNIVSFAGVANIPDSVTITTADRVGTCQLVQESTGVKLYYIDGPVEEDVTITSPFDDTALSAPTFATVYAGTSANETVSFGNKPAYAQIVNEKSSVVANVTSGTYTDIFGLLYQGETTDNASRDIYLLLSGETRATRVSGVQNADWENDVTTDTTGDVLVQIGGDAQVDYAFGAGIKGGKDAKVTGNTGVTICDSAIIKGSVFGGWSSAHKKNPTVDGNTCVLVKNVQSNDTADAYSTLRAGFIVGGSTYESNDGASRTTITGSSSAIVKLEDSATGTFSKVIVGGSFYPADGEGWYSGYDQTQAVAQNSSVSISAPLGVSFTNAIVGGGYTGKRADGVKTTVGGNASVAINGGTYTGTIVAGAYAPSGGTATVAGTATLTLNGGVFTGATLMGGNATGAKTLELGDSVNVSSVGSVSGFDIINIPEGSSLSVDSISGSGNVEKRGTGTLTLSNSAAATGTLTVDAGTLAIASGTPCKLTIKDGATVNASGTIALSGANKIESGGVLNVTGGNVTLTTGTNGDGIKGTINIKNGATLTAATGDALWYAADSAGNGVINVEANGTLAMGDVRWTLGANNQINLYEGATITGNGPANGNLDMNNNNGTKTIHALGNSTISATIAARRDANCEIIVDEGKTLTVSGRIFGDYQITKKGAGTLKLTYPNGNTGTEDSSFTVPILEEGTIEFAGSGAWNVNVGERRNLTCYTYSGSGSLAMSVTQTAEEYGKGSDIAVTGIPSVLSSITFNKRGGGESEDITVSEGAATLTGSGDVAIAGDATIYDITFANNSSDTKDSGNFTHTCGTGTLKYDTTPTFNNSEFDETTGVYLKHHPYIDGAHSIFNSLTDFTVVVVGTMSPTAKTMFIHFGSSSSSNPGLLIATTDTANEVVIATTTGSTVNDGPGQGVTAKIPNAATARHAFVVAKSGTTLTVYADGIKRGTFTVAEGFKLGVSSHSGMQVGSDFGGEIAKKKEYNNVDASSGAETGVINVIRVFDYAISENQALKVTREYPYVTQGGLYTRTISEDANLSAEDAWAKDGFEETFNLPEGATVSEQSFAPSATLTASGLSTLTVNADLHLETLTIEGSAPLSIVSDGSHAIYPTTAVINSPVTNSYGAVNLNGTTVQFNSTGALCIDCSGLDISEVFTRTTYQLTGVIDEDAERFSVILPTATSRTATLNYNSNGFYEIEVTPDREGGIDVYYKEGYWSGSEKTFKVTSNGTDLEAVFPGDTVVVDGKSSQDPMYFGSSLPVNVAAIKIAKDIRIASGNTGGSAILGDATVTVADGFTLTIQRNSHDIKLGAVVLNKDGANGTGAVALDANDGTITVSAAITGTAPIAIAENKSVTVEATGSIANIVELKSGSTLVVNSSATVGDVVTNVSHSRVVSSESAGVTTYRVELIPGTVFSVW